MSTRKLEKSAKVSAKRHEAFIKMTAKQITLAKIKDMLIGLSEKVDRLEQKISNMDSQEQFKIATEEYLIKNEADFYEEIENKDWNTNYEDKLTKPINFFINSITFALF
ncbi:hypothetical protein F8M41_015547 [Gigaspora margarita]|uniref:Uncharacterized protein n=1 Tax=Gigaspora margarita TaxID=4874 RepID=A0A8H4EN37_GIGMA|nr:hypothetical protein F8M41_015547 [Gigaspora margarita]